MAGYLINRFLQAIVLLFVVSAMVFFVIHAAPGGPALLNNPEIDRETAQQMAENLGLNDPIPLQYARWLGNVVQGKLGMSYQHGVAVSQMVSERLPATLLLTITSIVLAVLIAVPLGIVSAVKPYSIFDYLATLTAFFGVSVPVFWMGLMLIILFSVELRWLPSGGMLTTGEAFSMVDLLRHLLLPTIVLSTFSMAQLARYTRSSMLDVIRRDYVRTARSKGLGEQVVLWRHALKNALIPVVTVIGLQLPRAFGGAAITEAVFSWPGMGRLAVDSAFQRDYPVVMGISMMIALVVVISNLITDLAYVYLDPRVRLR